MTKCHAVPAKTIKLSYGSGPFDLPACFFAKTAAFYLSSALCSNRSFIFRILPICRLE